MKNLILIKLGGSLITDKTKPYTVRYDVLRRLCKEIHEVRKRKKLKLVVAHGGGSFPHVSAKKYKTHLGFVNEKSKEGFSKVQNDAAKLNRIVVEELIRAKENAISIQPSASCVAKKGRILKWFTKPLEMILENDMIPVPYGDVCNDVDMGCSIISTEEILKFLSKKLKPEKVVMLTNVDGVLDPDGNTVKVITKKKFKEIKSILSGSGGIADVTGGMLHKVRISLNIARFSGKVEIINGLKKGYLRKSLLNENVKGTVIKV